MTNLVDWGRGPWQAMARSASRLLGYVPYGEVPAPFEIMAFIRGVRADDLWAAALQTDIVAIIAADDLAAAMPGRPRPLRYDRIDDSEGLGMRYSVEEWRAAPQYGAPIFFKLLLRGGNQ